MYTYNRNFWFSYRPRSLCTLLYNRWWCSMIIILIACLIKPNQSSLIWIAFTVVEKSRIFFETNWNDIMIWWLRNDHLPSLDDKFVIYGKDKTSWIENLRYIGYHFSVIAHSFAINIPHLKFNKSYINNNSL